MSPDVRFCGVKSTSPWPGLSADALEIDRPFFRRVSESCRIITEINRPERGSFAQIVLPPLFRQSQMNFDSGFYRDEIALGKAT